jgi:hypothetical protein
MHFVVIFLAALLGMAALGLVSWAWFATAQVEKALRSIAGYEAMNFELRPRAVDIA